MLSIVAFFISLSAFSLSAELRSCMGRILDRSGLEYSQQHRLQVGQGQRAIDRRIRGFIHNARPAEYQKHTKASSVEEARSMSVREAQYLPGVRLSVERRALNPAYPALGFQEGSGRMFKYVEFPDVVGFDGGQPTRFMRVELSPTGEFHGHPMSLQRVRSACSSCVARIRSQ